MCSTKHLQALFMRNAFARYLGQRVGVWREGLGWDTIAKINTLPSRKSQQIGEVVIREGSALKGEVAWAECGHEWGEGQI